MIFSTLPWYLVLSASIILFLVISCQKIILFYNEYRRKVHAVQGIGCDDRHWLLGNLNKVEPTQRGLDYSCQLLKQFPKCMQIWLGPLVFYLSCFHPDLIKPILSTDEPKDDIAYRFLRPWIGDGLLVSSGNKWKRNRRLLTPAFHFGILKHYLVVFNTTTEVLLKKWSERGQNVFRVEMFKDIGLMSLDTILQCIMSKRSNCQYVEKNDYISSVRVLSEVAMKRIFNPFYYIDWLFNLTPMGFRYRKALRIAHEYTEKVIDERIDKMERIGMDLESFVASCIDQEKKGKKEVRLDFLDILLLTKDDQGTGLNHREICDEVDTFLFEGHDTVSSGISWTFYSLAKHKKYQELCRKEVQKVIGERKRVEWEDLTRLPYLTMCIKESLRLYPPVFSITRKNQKPMFFNRGFGPDQYNTGSKPSVNASCTLPKHFNLGISIYQLHRNPHIWENPETFDPERFTPDNIAKRPPHAFLPFSSGPRNCIGQNFAMNEMKVVLALALSNFRFSLDETSPAPELQPHIILHSRTGIHLKLEKL